MKQIMLMALGAAVLYQVARKNGINSLADLKGLLTRLTDKIDLAGLREWVNVDKLKDLVAPRKEEETMATA